jgi:hypothetical protein
LTSLFQRLDQSIESRRLDFIPAAELQELELKAAA